MTLAGGQARPASPASTDPTAPADSKTATKTFRTGTHRVVAPGRTLERVSRFLAPMGITRIANVTGLDTIGIPVVMVCRPNSRSLSVAQGKGLDLDAARASGVMESIESWHAEHIVAPLKLGSFEELRYTHRVVDVNRLHRATTSRFHPDFPILWIEGCDLLSGEPTWVPYETVHTNFTMPHPTGSGCFPLSTNGLASGNHVLEATSHAVCEVVERDSTTLFHARPAEERAERRVDLSTVDDPACRLILDRLEQADIAVVVWETTTDVGIPAYLSMIDERAENALRPLYTAMGAGCHPAREIALLRSLTEAAQSRLTYISGARDDMWRESYTRFTNADTLHRNRALHRRRRADRYFHHAPTFVSDSIAEDVQWQLDRLRAVGVDEVVAVDLSRPEVRIPVVRVVIPGLEGPSDTIPGYVFGPRAHAVRGR